MRTPYTAGRHCLLLILAAVFLYGSYTPALQRVEELGYLAATRWMPEGTLSSKVAVVAVDQQALQRIGPWPWSRDRVAVTVDRLRRIGVRAVGLLLPLHEPETSPKLAQLVEETAKNKKLASAARAWATRLDTDAALAAAVAKSGAVVLAAQVVPIDSSERANTPAPKRLQPPVHPTGLLQRLAQPLHRGPVSDSVMVNQPITLLATAAAGVGLVVAHGVAGSRAGTPLLFRVGDDVKRSFVTRLAELGAGKRIEPISNDTIRSADHTQRLGPGLRFVPQPVDTSRLPVFSLGALWDDGMETALKGKIVLVGPTAPELTTQFAGPGGELFTAVTWAGFNLASFLAGSGVAVAPSFHLLQRALILLLAMCLAFLPARLHGRGGFVACLVAALALLNVELLLLLTRQLWVPLVLPALFVLVGQSLLTALRAVERPIERSREAAAEAYLALGATLQDHGQLDAAFTQFRKCPLGENVLERLYQLGLDYESARKFAKAVAIYEHMAATRPGYRDVRERRTHLKSLLVGSRSGAGSSPAKKTVLMDASSIERPTLSHYRLEHELGKGAMAVVYLALDLNLGRHVALKTLSLNEEFEGDALEEAEQRFAREAEAAARLNHPNIVTIFEAGKDHDLAYIAMDYVEGESLECFTDEDALLPVREVLEIGAQVAEALDYAHENHIVHRDVKPSNIIYVRDTGTVKVTDFGIAHLTNDSQTRTGAVLGTPSYMSPEQAAGQKVDGRTDLFSLGVTVYQLLSGRLPFVGDSLANLIYRIATEKPQGIRKFRPGLNGNLSRVINRALQKDPEKRFSTGKAMAEALLKCREQIRDDPPVRRQI